MAIWIVYGVARGNRGKVDAVASASVLFALVIVSLPSDSEAGRHCVRLNRDECQVWERFLLQKSRLGGFILGTHGCQLLNLDARWLSLVLRGDVKKFALEMYQHTML